MLDTIQSSWFSFHKVSQIKHAIEYDDQQSLDQQLKSVYDLNTIPFDFDLLVFACKHESMSVQDQLLSKNSNLLRCCPSEGISALEQCLECENDDIAGYLMTKSRNMHRKQWNQVFQAVTYYNRDLAFQLALEQCRNVNVQEQLVQCLEGEAWDCLLVQVQWCADMYKKSERKDHLGQNQGPGCALPTQTFTCIPSQSNFLAQLFEAAPEDVARTTLHHMHNSRLQSLWEIGEGGSSLLHEAAYGEVCEQVEALLALEPRLLSVCDHALKSPLHIAAWRGHLPITSALLSCGAQVDAKDCLGNTALHYGCALGAVDIAQQLLTGRISGQMRGYLVGNIDIPNNKQQTPLHCALMSANMPHQIDLVRLLLKHKANPLLSDAFHVTPLNDALRHGNATILKMLLADTVQQTVDIMMGCVDNGGGSRRRSLGGSRRSSVGSSRRSSLVDGHTMRYIQDNMTDQDHVTDIITDTDTDNQAMSVLTILLRHQYSYPQHPRLLLSTHDSNSDTYIQHLDSVTVGTSVSTTTHKNILSNIPIEDIVEDVLHDIHTELMQRLKHGKHNE